MSNSEPRRVAVIDFNAPELTQLALGLARRGRLHAFVRPYVNKQRPWERALERLPGFRRAYRETFGRRRLADPALAALTWEAGVLPDAVAALLTRFRALPTGLRLAWRGRLHDSLRHAVASVGTRAAGSADAVIAYPGFGRAAFSRLHEGGGLAVLNYPIAHHRYHQQVREREIEAVPEFASTWPPEDDWSAERAAQIDEEIAAADLVLLGSRFARQSFVDQGISPERLAVAAYGVDHELFAPLPVDVRRERRGFAAIFVGQIGQRKGLSYLLSGYRQFARADSTLTLVGNFAGADAPLRRHADLFRHLPNQPRADLARLYGGCDVLVFPTLLEGMGLVVLEAMACGLPVIVTDCGPGDLVRDGLDGYVVPARDPDAIAERLDRLYRDPDRRIEMGRRARTRSLEYTWAAYQDRVQNAVDGVACGRRATPVPA